MDLLRLDQTDYNPDVLIEGYSSLIWTERYLDAGEFELKTADILRTKNLLPEGSLISHRETDEVMMVESHLIGKNQEGFNELTVKGRSLVTFTEHRYLEGAYPKKKFKMLREYTPAEAAVVVLWNALVNPSKNDVTIAGDNTRSDLDKVPNVLVTNSVAPGTGINRRRWLEGGQVYPQVVNLLTAGRLGMRTMRPNGSSGRVVDVTISDKGVISYDQRDDILNLRFDVYDGLDRSREQNDRDPVVFSFASDYLKEPSYLWSIVGYETLVLVVSGVGTRRFFRIRKRDEDLSGLERRVLWIDGGEPDLEEIPEKPDRDDGATDQDIQQWKDKRDRIRERNATARAEFLEDLTDAADVALEAHERIRLFDAKITSASPYEYKVHYNLGDKVSLIGEYEFDQKMQVVEHVRTEDAAGDVGYPGLAAIE
jgi:hypothetical protein